MHIFQTRPFARVFVLSCCSFFLLLQTYFIHTNRLGQHWTSAMQNIHTRTCMRKKNTTQHNTAAKRQGDSRSHTDSEEEACCSLCSGCARQVEIESVCLYANVHKYTIYTQQKRYVSFVRIQICATAFASSLLPLKCWMVCVPVNPWTLRTHTYIGNWHTFGTSLLHIRIRSVWPPLHAHRALQNFDWLTWE